MNRRQFFTRAITTLPLMTAGAALAELLEPRRTIFLPPRGGWTWVDYGRVEEECFAEFSKACHDLRALILKTIGEAPREFAVPADRYAKIVRGGMELQGHLLYTDSDVEKRNFLLMGVPVVPVVGLDAVLLARM